MKFDMILYNQNTKKKAKLFYVNTDSFTIYVKTEDIYGRIAGMYSLS